MLGRVGKIIATGAATAALSLALTVGARAETLAETLAAAYMESGLLDQNRAVLRAADEDVAQAIAALRPVISWSGNVTRSFGTSGGTNIIGTFTEGGSASNTAAMNIVAQVTLFNGGLNRLRIDAAKESVLATRAGLVSIEQQVLFRGVQAFMEVRRAVETLALRQNNVRVISEELRAARDRFAVGDVTRTDVSLAEARLSAARSSLAAAEGSLAIAIEEYAAVTGRRPGNLVPPSALPRLPPEAEARAIALRYHPSLLRAQHVVTTSELAIAIAEAGLKPTVSLRGSYGVTENFNERDYNRGGSIGLNASGPIYSGGALSALVRQAKAERDAQRANLHVVARDIEQSVGNAYAQLRVNAASRVAFQDQVRASTVAFRGVREEATLGARTTLDVLDAEQELLNARANLISSQIDEMVAAYAILASIGRLTSEDLQLAVPRYDPAEYYNLVKDAPAGLSQQGRELDRVLRALGKD